MFTLPCAFRDKWNMQGLFTDFLSFRGGDASRMNGKYGDDEPEHLWLGGQAQSAQDLGVEVQFCMAGAHQLLMSLEWGSVTNARANGDGGLDLNALIYTSTLASTVGLGWSKDNLRTADRCYNDALFPNGTVKFKCDSSYGNQFVNGHFMEQTSQTILATLSLGPVGISDQLSDRPDKPGAAPTSNKMLVMSTCAKNGTLLRPSYPLTPIEPILTHQAGWTGAGHCKPHPGSPPCPKPTPAPHVWATYTAVAAASPSATAAAAVTDIYFTVVAYMNPPPGKDNWPVNYSKPVTIKESYLSSMVDTEHLPTPGGFSDIPTGGFAGPGDTFPNSSSITGHVWWAANITSADVGCAGISAASPFESEITVAAPKVGQGQPALINVAPVHGDVALLGEAGKVTAVSVFRFASVSPAANGLELHLRGVPGETVPLLFAKRKSGGNDFGCVQQVTTIGADGTAVVMQA